MKRQSLIAAATVILAAGLISRVAPHCQIPCGIYDDPVRFTMMLEDVTTIEKSMQSIAQLSQEKTPNWNQLVRWVDNKEVHADKLIDTAANYFLTQRVKPVEQKDASGYEAYIGQIAALHQIMVCAMKAKQTTDLENCKKLRALIEEFRTLYTGAQVAAAPAAKR